jgi:two-component system capsular synthesis sensor histidine kinase RcsC
MPQRILARTYRYNRRLLFGAATTLSLAILGIAFLAVATIVDQYRDKQVALFVTKREQVRSEVDDLSTRLMQFVDLYEGAWSLHQRDYVPLREYQQRLLAENGVSAAAADLTVTPFTIVSGLTTPQDANRLATLLRVLRDVSAAPSIDARKIGVTLQGDIYAPDGQFTAFSPPLNAEAQSRARSQGGVRFNLERAAFAESLLAGKSTQALRTKRPFWVTDRRITGRGTSVSEIVVPIFHGDDRILTIDVSVDFDDFLQFFLHSERTPGFFVLDSAQRQNLGYAPTTAVEERRYHAVRQQTAIIGRADGELRTYRIDGMFYITQKIDGPDWIAVYVFDWRDMIVSLHREVAIALCIVIGSLLFLWSAAFYFDRRVAGPLTVSVQQRIEAEHFSKSIIDTIPVGVSVYIPDADQVVLENGVAARMLGVDKGQNGADLYRQFADDGLLSSGTKRKHVFREIEWSLSEDRPAYIGVTASTITFSGRPALLFGLIDLNFKKANERLLIAAKEKADEANRAKSMFLALMTHEIRTPLHGAIGHLELLEREVVDPGPAERISMIRRSFDSLLTIVGDLLDLTKIESDALTISNVRMCVNDVVEQCVQHFAPTITQQGLRCVCVTDPALDRAVYGDDQRLTQILQNLLSNAAKFTEHGSIAVHSRSMGNGDGQHHWVRIEVSDTGIGVAAALQSTLFNPLSQADDTISRRFGGTGLGLFLCRKLTGLMGGRISLKSAPGAGSTFYVDLPFESAPHDDEAEDDGDVLPSPRLRITSDAADGEWRSALSQRIAKWGAVFVDGTDLAPYGPLAEKSVESARHAYDVFIAMPDLAKATMRGSTKVRLQPRLGTLHLGGDLPLVPRFEPDGVYLTSLSRHALRETLRQLASDSASESTTQPRPPARGTSPRSDLDIVIAEDEAVSRTLLLHQLQRLGYQRVRSAENGLDALMLWRERPADLVITDLSMPTLDGLGLLKEIRRIDPRAKVVFTTASNKSELAGGLSEFNGQLAKPVLLATLARVIESVTRARSSDANAHDGASLDAILWETFSQEWPKDRAGLDAALAADDYRLAERRIHRLQGAFLTIGNTVLIGALAALQEAVLTQDRQGIHEAWSTLQTHAERLMTTTRSPSKKP